MKVSLSWMREFVPGLPNVEASEETITVLADTLSDLGLAVEGIERTGPGASWDGIVVAKVVELRPHPEADRIQLVDVVIAPQAEPLQICCGAFNMSVGDLVPLATLGTTMPNGMEIERRKLRGEWSNGMLCSGSELGLSSDHDGIHLLSVDPDLLGAPLIEAVEVSDDVIFDLDVTGNRPEALSVLGVARDLAARMGLAFHDRTPEVDASNVEVGDAASVVIAAPDLCPRFGLRVLRDVSMGSSPTWMADRLVAAGMRPINLVVDISNYVMLERGQPNHTYDLDRVNGARLGVRMARSGESLETLDGQRRELSAADGLIVDGDDQPIGLAGVMGGASTEISDATTTVLLEAAVWHQMTVARTSRRLGLRSEASIRFERGVDPLGIERALDRFCELAQELGGASVDNGTTVVEGNYAPPATIDVSMAQINAVLNASLDGHEAARLIEPIGFGVAVTGDQLSVTPPSYRPDVTIGVDVIEEIGRMRGFGASGKRVPVPEQSGGLTADQHVRRRIHRALLSVGFHEAMPLPFLAPTDLERAGLSGETISLVNPLVADESVLRTSLLPGLCKAVAHNQAHRIPIVRLYEIGSVWPGGEGHEGLPAERRRIGFIASGFSADGSAATAAVEAWWRIVGALAISPDQVVLANAPAPSLHANRSATLKVRGRVVGEVGEVAPSVSEAFDIDGRVGWCQIDLDAVVAVVGSAATYQRVSRMPSSDFDLALVVPDHVPVSDVTRSIRRGAGDLARSVELFDVYRGAGVPEGSRSLAFRVRLQSEDATLTESELTATRAAVLAEATKRHGAVLRA